MKYIMVAYIKSAPLLASIESIAEYYGLSPVEDNPYYRMMMGYYRQPLNVLIENLYKELDGEQFDIEDTLSIIYTKGVSNGVASLGNVVLKRKGNRHLRRREMN